MKSYFNSIKVRLKLREALREITKETHFNSIKVRLKLDRLQPLYELFPISIP